MTAYTIDAARSYLREVAEAGGWLAELDALLAQPIGYAHVLPGFHDAWAAYHESEVFDEAQMGEMVGALGMVEAIARPGCLSDRQAERERIERMMQALAAEPVEQRCEHCGETQEDCIAAEDFLVAAYEMWQEQD